VDLVYSTAGAWSAQLAALWLKKSTGVFWMTEIHDPLVIRNSPDDLGFATPSNRDARFRKWLEAQICKHADLAWWFTDGAVHYAKLRNPNLNEPGNAKGVMVIPGAEPPGAAEEIIAAAKQAEEAQPHHYGAHLVISHFGSLAKNRSISTILNRLPTLFKNHPEARNAIQVHVYGAKVDSLTAESIDQHGFADLVSSMAGLKKIPSPVNRGASALRSACKPPMYSCYCTAMMSGAPSTFRPRCTSTSGWAGPFGLSPTVIPR
jgi:hypothetical protein